MQIKRPCRYALFLKGGLHGMRHGFRVLIGEGNDTGTCSRKRYCRRSRFFCRPQGILRAGDERQAVGLMQAVIHDPA